MFQTPAWPVRRARRTATSAGKRAHHTILAKRNIDHLIIDFVLDLGGNCLLFVRGGGAGVGISQLFDLRLLQASRTSRPFCPCRCSAGSRSGSSGSAEITLVMNVFQPPSFGGFWLARRLTTVCQSAACTSTLKAAPRSSCAITIGCVFFFFFQAPSGQPACRHSRITASSFLASAMPVPLTMASEPCAVSSGEPQDEDRAAQC